jgi:hypothetical protein
VQSWPPTRPTIFSARLAGMRLPVIRAAGSVADVEWKGSQCLARTPSVSARQWQYNALFFK